MPNICGKHVNRLGEERGKTSGLMSTVPTEKAQGAAANRAQPVVLHKFSHFLHSPSPQQNTLPYPWPNTIFTHFPQHL